MGAALGKYYFRELWQRDEARWALEANAKMMVYQAAAGGNMRRRRRGPVPADHRRLARTLPAGHDGPLRASGGQEAADLVGARLADAQGGGHRGGGDLDPAPLIEEAIGRLPGGACALGVAVGAEDDGLDGGRQDERLHAASDDDPRRYFLARRCAALWWYLVSVCASGSPPMNGDAFRLKDFGW